MRSTLTHKKGGRLSNLINAVRDMGIGVTVQAPYLIIINGVRFEFPKGIECLRYTVHQKARCL